MTNVGCLHDRWRVEAQNTAGFGRCLDCTIEVPLDRLFNGLRERMEANAPTAARVLEAFSDRVGPSVEALRLDLARVEGRVQKLEDSLLCQVCGGTGRKKEVAHA